MVGETEMSTVTEDESKAKRQQSLEQELSAFALKVWTMQEEYRRVKSDPDLEKAQMEENGSHSNE
jgi:hypothetical protein